MTSETDADNKTTQYQYDAYGRVISALHPVTNNQSGERYQVEDIWEYNDQIVDNSPNYFDADNKYLVTSRVDAYTKTTKLNNNVASYENYTHEFYDGFGNLVLQGKLDIAKNNELIVAQYHYDIMARPEYVMDMSGNVSKTSYDAWGRNNEMIDPFSNLYRNEYDLIDHKKTSYFVASTDIPAFRSNPQDSLKRNVLESTSDNWGRETMRKGFPNWPNRTTNVVQENYSYDDAGNVTAYTDPNRNTTGYAYDKLNQLTSVTNPLNQTTSYAYTKLGQLKSTTQSDGTKTWVSSKDYDETGFLKSSADPANTLDKFSRNKLGQITLRTDPNGNLINYVYDESGRNIFKQVNATLLKNVYQYSSYGPTRQEETRSGATFMTVYNDYNMYGSQTYKANVSDGVVNIVRHEFDDQNKLKNVSDPFDFFTQYGYDKTRISKVQTNGASTASSADTANAFYQYEPDGKVSSITYPKLGDGSILKTSKSYDGIGRQIKVSNTKGSTVLSDYQYGYDANGNIISITDNAGTTNYQYDKLNRLIQVRRANGQTVVYAYDVRGNRSTLKGDSNLEDSADKTYTFNAWDQLQTVTKGQQTTQFEYEMQGLRLYKSTGSTKTRYAYNNSGQVISEADATNQAVANYVWGPDRLLEKRDTASNKKYYYMYNGHGDVVQVIDENGTVVNKYQYDEWGNILQQSEQVPNSFKYAGEMQDAETGLYYLRARYYDPSAGRFISKDTYQGDVSNPLSQNLYTYVENAPLNNIDPTGNWCTSANGKYSHPGGCNDSNNWKNYSDDMSHDGQTIKNGPNFVGPPSVYNYPVEQRYARWYAGDVTAFEGASDKVKQQLAYMAKSDWTWSDAIRWFTAGAVTGAVILSPGSGLAALEVGTIGTSTYSATTLTGGTAVLFNILTRGKSVSAIPALNAVAKKALSVNRPITGIIRSDGTIEAYVQDAQFSYSHRGLGLTKADTGFNMSFYEGKWSITGSGYATSQGWRQPSVAQKEMITSMFGVK
nr:RHS repeat-associated core domain-containing protein [Paenibacillus shirakamiensis]